MDRRHERQRGVALLLTVVLGALVFALWAVAYRSTRDGIRAEKRVLERTRRDETATRVLANAMALLRTGVPSGSRAAYKSGKTAVIFTNVGGYKWTVEARTATAAELRKLPALPGSFGS